MDIFSKIMYTLNRNKSNNSSSDEDDELSLELNKTDTRKGPSSKSADPHRTIPIPSNDLAAHTTDDIITRSKTRNYLAKAASSSSSYKILPTPQN